MGTRAPLAIVLLVLAGGTAAVADVSGQQRAHAHAG